MPVSRFRCCVFLVLWPCLLAHCLAQQTAANRLPSSEREALRALYKATGGSDWKDKSGWLGPQGTECEWHGVQCGERQHNGETVPTVWFLDLGQNNLVGTIPPQIGALEGLQWLSLYGNKITGILPNALIQRWLDGALDISAEAHLLTAITVIDYSFLASSALCPQRRVTLDSTGLAFTYTTICRNQTPDDRTTYCDVEQGQLSRGEFARLAWTIERSGFFQLKPNYNRAVTEGVFEDIRVTRAGIAVEVTNYADAGPLEIWDIQRAIQGVAADMEVQKKSRTDTCPKRVPSS
jgi:hypothetical protein